MKTFPFLLAAAVALVAMTATADAAKKKHRYRPAPMAQCVDSGWNTGGYFGYGPCGNDYSGRRDPLTWEGPLNAWDKARRDDANLGRW